MENHIHALLDYVENELGRPGAFETLGQVRHMMDKVPPEQRSQELQDRYDRVRHECYVAYHGCARTRDKCGSGACVILYYNPQDGYRAVGPFDSREVAQDRAHSWGKVVNLLAPNSDVDGASEGSEHPADPADVESELRKKGSG